MSLCIFEATGQHKNGRSEYRCKAGCRHTVWSPHPPERIFRECLAILYAPRGLRLGDRVAKLTGLIGIKPCGGCKKRQKTLNDWTSRKSHVLLQFPHGLGDHVQFTIVLQHVQKYRRDLVLYLKGSQYGRSLFKGLYQEGEQESYDLEHRVLWEEPNDVGTKAHRCLVELFGIDPLIELSRYAKPQPTDEQRQQAREYLAGKVRPVLIHCQGTSFRHKKDLPEDLIQRLCETLRGADVHPVVLDWQGAKHDACFVAALAEESILNIGIDSGPGHVFGAVDTPAIIVWTGHHPVHYYGLSPNVLHLVPANHVELLRGDRNAGQQFFRDHYRHQIYLDLEESLCTAARQAIGFTGREITLNVPQGLGDIWWPYALAAPHFDRINLNLLTIGSDAQQFRSCEWPGLLPKAGAVNFRLVHSDDYGRRAATKTTAAEIVERWETGQHEQDLACNGWLEAGNRLEELGEPQWDIDMRSEPHGLPYQRYVCLAVSGDTARHPSGLWPIDTWLECVDLLYRRYEWDLPVVLLGADFDRPATEPLAEGLRARGYTVDLLVSNTLCARKVDAVKRCAFFLGYQSGLNILADNFNRPQLMVFFNRLAKMIRSFAKPANLAAGLFNPALFRDGPAAAVGSIRWSSFAEIWREVEGVTLYDSQRARLLWNSCLSLPAGDVLEVGTYRGGTARLLARALPERRVWTIDTFAGLRPGERDVASVAGKFADCDLDGARQFVPANATVIPGRFPEVAPNVDRLVLLHFDADLHQPCKAALEWAWPRLVPGGVVFLDDYGRGDTPGVKAAVDEFGLQVEVVPELQIAIARKPWTP